MTDLRKAVENAIKVLEADAIYIEMMGGNGRFQREAQQSLRQALEQPECAACHELLEALVAISEIDRFDTSRITDESPHYVFGRCGEIAIAAISKATGDKS